MNIEEIKKILESYTLEKKYYHDLVKDIEEQQNIYNKTISQDSLHLQTKRINQLLKLSELTLEKIEKVEFTINTLNQPSKDILYYKYIKKLSNSRIAMGLNYSVPRIYQLTSIAIKEFAVHYSSPEKN